MEKATADDIEYIRLPNDLQAVTVLRSQSFDENGILFEWSEERQHPYYFEYSDVLQRNVKQHEALNAPGLSRIWTL